MHPDQVFVRKVQDLRNRVDVELLATKDDADYEVLMAAPLLRELLLGEPPLFHIVNRERRLKIRFVVARSPEESRAYDPDTIYYARGDGIYPKAAISGSTEATLNLDKFLREPASVFEGQQISVRELIDYTANAAGGVHFGDMEKDKRNLLAAVDRQLNLGGIQATLRSLIGVGNVVVDGLNPLVERVEAEARR